MPPFYEPHCASCPTVRPFACLSVAYGLLIRKQKKRRKSYSWCERFPGH